MVEENLTLSRVLTPLGDNYATTADNLAGITITVKLAETNPFTELLGIGNLDKRNLLLRLLAKSLDKLDVRLFGDRVTENTEKGVAGRQGLGSLTKTTSKTVVNKGTLKSTLKSLLNGHFTRSGGLNGNFDFLDGDNFFDIRLAKKMLDQLAHSKTTLKCDNSDKHTILF